MKCDELKPIELECNMGKDVNGVEHREPWKAYDIDEVDALLAKKDAEIAELKDKCQMHDFFWEGCGFAKRGFKNTIAVSEAFDRLEAENAELKKKLMPCLNGDCILTCEVVEKYGKENAELKQKLEDAGMRERRLKRALWIHRAIVAKLNKEGCKEMRAYNPFIGIQEYQWERVEAKCRAMAEKFGEGK